MRGIVISPEIEILGENHMCIRSSDIHPQKLREYLLYWDKIDFPISNIIHFGGNSDIEYLEQAGVLKRSKINLHESGEFLDLFLKCQMEAFLRNNKEQVGSWALAQPNSNLALPKDSSIQTRAIEVQLYRSLPVPTSDVPFEDILNFKHRRNDELHAFRDCMDKLYDDILISQDIERAMERNLSKIERRITDIDKLLNESMLSKVRKSMKVSLNISDLVFRTMVGASLGNELKFPSTIGGMLGAISSFIKIDIDVVRQPKTLPPEVQDYAYLYYSKNEI